jgi:hypothetical protein
LACLIGIDRSICGGANDFPPAAATAKEFRAHARPQPSEATPACPTSAGVHKGAIAPGETAHSEAFANCAATPRGESAAAGIQAAAYATANPNPSDSASLIGGTSNVSAALGGTSGVLGLMTDAFNNLPMGGTNYLTQYNWNVTLGDFSSLTPQLYLGLVNASSTGNGTVAVTIDLNNGDGNISDNFASFSAADGFFTDNVIDFGTLGDTLSSSQTLTVQIDVTVNPTTSGASFDPNMVLATPTVPEPVTMSMLLPGVGLVMKRRRRG